MNRFQFKPNDNRGAVLIPVVLVLALVTIIGVSATSISITEQQIATNDKQHKIVQYHTDAGLAATAKLINKAYDTDKLVMVESEMSVLGTDEEVYNQLTNYANYDYGMNDFQYSFDNSTVNIDVHRWATVPGVATQSVEFITGTQGKSSGGTGATFAFRVVATGQGVAQTNSRISANYMKLDEANAGGL